MLHSGTVRLHCLHVLVQDSKYLIVEDLVLPDAICHLLQWHIFDDLVLAILPLDFEQVVAEVEEVKRRCCPSSTMMAQPAQFSPSPKHCSAVNSCVPTGMQ